MDLKIISCFTALFMALSLAVSPASADDDKKPVADVTLTDQEGKSFQLHDLKSNYVFAAFVYTRCPVPDMCPRTMSQLKNLEDHWKRQPQWQRQGFPLRILAVTLDPQFDTPAVMKAEMLKYGLDPQHFIYATGEPKDLDILSAHFNLLSVPGKNLVAHGVKAALISPVMVPLREYKDNAWTADEVLGDIQKSVAWWKWFFCLSALLAAPGLLLLWWLRKYSFEPQTPAPSLRA